MIRFNIIGTGFLDLEDTGGIAFKTENQHFRFADISLGRSVEFSIPATDRNRMLLGFGEDPAESGDMLRVVHGAQMVYDGGAKMGSLSVTAYEGNAFKCVFSIGNADWLERLQDLKLSDTGFDWPKGVSWGPSQMVIDANAADPTEGALIVRYDNGTLGAGSLQWQLVPSVNVKQYLIDLFATLGVPFSSNIGANYWMVSGSLKGGLTDVVTLASTAVDNATVTQSQNYLDVIDIDVEWATSIVFGAYVGGGSTAAKGFKALQDITMKMPSAMPAGCYLVRWSERLGKCEVLGGVSTGGIGDPLDGKTFNIKAGQVFFFATKGFYADNLGDAFVGWKDTYHPFSFSCTVESDGSLPAGNVWYLRNNHPDMTVFEFLKSVALATGLELTIDGDTGVTLAPPQYGVSTMKPLLNVLSVDSVSRRVEAWGNDTHDSVVGFDSEDYVTDFIRSGYSIENEQLQAETEHKAKFSEGNVGTNGILIRDVDDSSGTPKLTAKKWTICYADPNEAYLQRIATPSPVGYDDLAANSTAMRVRCALPLAEFFSLQPSTVWVWRGCAYLWTDASWSDGVLTMTLQRVSQPASGTQPTPPPPTPTLTGISASFSQGGAVVVGTDSLDTLKQYLTVTATYSDSTTRVLAANEYTLSGTLAYPSATVTAQYQGESDTFTVDVAYDAQVEYLQSTGTQYVDTGIVVQENDTIIADAQFISGVTTTYNTIADAFGGTGEGSIFIRLRSASFYIRFGSTNTEIYGTQGLAFNRNIYTVKKSEFLVNGIHVGSPGYASMPSSNIVIGRVSSNTSFVGKLFGLSIKKYDEDYRIDIIPVRCGTVGYMYDRVSGHLFANAGTGDFIVGADV